MKIRIFTDPHLGLNRSENTSQKSQALLREKLFHEAVLAANVGTADFTVMCGDLFDRYSNKESVILQGIELAGHCNGILAGNHDHLNIEGQEASLDVVSRACPGIVVKSPDIGKPYYKPSLIHGKILSAVPHCLTQDVFEASVRLACEAGGDVLFLHCNYQLGFGESGGDSSALNLTPELTDLVCASFKRIFIGHEHVPAKHRGGQVVILGNIFPIAFGEIADRFVYIYDTDTDELEEIEIFNAAEESQTIPLDDFLAAQGDIETSASMVEISGEMAPDAHPLLSKSMATFWKTNEETLLAVKKDIHVDSPHKVKRQDLRGMDYRQRVRAEAEAAGYGKEINALISDRGATQFGETDEAS